MAVDREAHRVLVAFRSPARLLVLSPREGVVVADLDTCGDADDVFVDAKRHRIYVAWQVGTAPGARTALFIPEMDRLFSPCTLPVESRVGEIACERDFGRFETSRVWLGPSGKFATIWRSMSGLRGGRVNDRGLAEIRAGLTFNFAVRRHTRAKE